MAITNNPIHNTNTTALQGHNAENTPAPQQNNRVVARGVDMLQKAWLHLTGQAREKHKEQLTNLKAQVERKFGEDGLQALNNKISAKKWDSPNSTKLFSRSELKSLRSDAFFGAKDIRLAQKLEAIDDTVQEMKEPRIDKKFNEIFNDLKSDVTKTMKHPEATQFVESIRTKNALQVDFEFLQAVKPYSSGAVKASPQEVNNLVAIVENFISDGTTFDEFSPNSIINLDDPKAADIQQACQDLKDAGSDAEKTAKAEALITKLGSTQEHIQNQVFNDKFNNSTAKGDLKQIARKIVENEILAMQG
ncbi:hypothetical protein [Thalassospira lucentensis]|uniref:hypothetical protein n=1 Tax=Thalassospira lucentensis TaxID=168935 RepID=UPI00142DC9A6|nr:hypothetical protein [Thalassospira lucentensis]NIZ02153.1 hypothetical protein [Thalassospira lucentensis]